jgi:hypothetical protein
VLILFFFHMGQAASHGLVASPDGKFCLRPEDRQFLRDSEQGLQVKGGRARPANSNYLQPLSEEMRQTLK